MKRNVFSVIASVIIAGTLVGAQNAPSQEPAPAPAAAPAPAPAASPSQDSPDDTTLRGCLIQGSGPTSFVLENAKLSTDPAGTKGKSYAVEISAEPDQIKSILNSHVQIVGKAEKESSSDDKKSDEKNMPKLTAKRISRLAATCPASGD
jgi:hypothetical protein